MANPQENPANEDEIEWEEYYDYHFPDDERKIGKIILKNQFYFSLLLLL